MKKISIRRIFSLILIVFVIGGVLYINSPRYIIKRTVMWYERDFTIPVFCKKVRFEYDRKTGNYMGKFKISEHQSQKIIEKLEYCKERASEANKKNSIKNEENLESLSPGVLNCTYVWNFMLRYDYEKEIALLYGKVDCVYSVYDADNPNVKIALPNKLYESIICELPIIVAKDTYLSELVQKWNVGVSVSHTDTIELIEVLKKYKNDKKYYGKYVEGCQNIKKYMDMEAELKWSRRRFSCRCVPQ